MSRSDAVSKTLSTKRKLLGRIKARAEKTAAEMVRVTGEYQATFDKARAPFDAEIEASQEKIKVAAARLSKELDVVFSPMRENHSKLLTEQFKLQAQIELLHEQLGLDKPVFDVEAPVEEPEPESALSVVEVEEVVETDDEPLPEDTEGDYSVEADEEVPEDSDEDLDDEIEALLRGA